MNWDGFVLIYKIAWHQGDIMDKLAVFGGSFMVICAVWKDWFCKKEINEGDSPEEKSFKMQENREISKNSTIHLVVYVFAVFYFYYYFGLTDTLTRMIFENMYR